MECTWGNKEFAEQLKLLQSMIDQETDTKRKLYLEKEVSNLAISKILVIL